MQRWARQFGLVGLLVMTLSALSACSVGPPAGVAAVTPFELERYLGRWYEIARLDHSFERGLSNASAFYALRADGRVEVINRGHEGEKGRWRQAVGTARFIGADNVGSLKVLFFGPFYGGYHVIALDPGYRWAMVIGPSRDYLWILARDKHLPDDIRQRLVAQVAALNIDPQQLIWVAQDRDDT